MDAMKKLQEWTFLWVKNKDILARQIMKIEEKAGELLVTKTTGLQKYFIMPELGSLKDIAIKEKNTIIVTFNTRANINCLLKQWNDTIDQPQLCVVFVNPESCTDQKWAVFPFTHHRISDSVDKGIWTMFENVEEWRV